VSHDPVLVNAAIAKLNLPRVDGKPYPVTNAAELLSYFSIALDPSVVEVDHDCTTLQIPPQKATGSIVPFIACNPTDRWFDGWRSSNQPDGSVLDMSSQQGFPTGTWLMEGVSFAPKPDGSDIVAIPGACGSSSNACPIPTGEVSHDPVLVNAAIAKLNLPRVDGKPYPVTNAAELLSYFSIALDPSVVEVDHDCTTLQIPPTAVSHSTFLACNPTDRWFDGWRSSKQVGFTLQYDQQQGFPTGRWTLEGVSFAPKPDGSDIVAIPGACAP
jgi:ribosome modulation factor